MQVTETSADGLKREFKIVVPAAELESQMTRRLGEIGRTIRLPGFRPGKVPMTLLRKRFGPSVLGEVLESTVEGSSGEAMRERQIRPALQPRVEIVSFAEGADLEYKMSVELLPEIPAASFDDLGLERLVVEVPAEEVEKALERLAEGYRKSEAVDRPAENGDVVVIDFAGTVGGAEIPGGKSENFELELGTGRFIPGFEDQLVGATAGEHRTLNVTFPGDYGSGDLAGKEAAFEVDVKEVRRRLPAAVDDSLAVEVGLETLDELRQDIRDRLRRNYDDVARQRLKRALLDKLAERYDFPVPEGMVEIEFQNIWSQYQAEKERQAEGGGEDPAGASGEPGPASADAATDTDTAAAAAETAALETEIAPASAPADAGSAGEGAAPAPAEAAAETAETAALESEAVPDAEEEQAKAEYRKIAERRVRLGLLLAEVGRGNNITVTQEEINQALTREARRHPGHEQQVLEFYRKNPSAVGNLQAPIFEEKVVDFIVELARLEERRVTPQELLALPADEAEEAAPAA